MSHQTPLLSIHNLHASVSDLENKPILQGVNLDIYPGEVHAIMGPNGAGKSTLANLLAAKPGYSIQSGTITFQGESLLGLTPEASAWKGIFLGFQYPVSIPGVSNIQFLKAAFNTLRHQQGKSPLDAMDFLNLVKEKMAILNMPESLLYRSLNDGFSGGEKKLNEVLQMFLLEPTLAILDETDSGLDIDTLKTVALGIHQLKSPERAIILITHYQRLLDYIEPDFIHVLSEGKIIHSGDKTLGLELEQKGYTWLNEQEA
jgi:Fe-S cluster assembly ATP-binding protein